jgi:hypothetical protein
MQDGVAVKRAALTICPSWFLVQLTLGMGLLSLQKIQMGLARGNAAVAVRYASAIDSLSAAIQVFISPRVSEMLDVYGRQPVLIATLFGDKTTQTACGGVYLLAAGLIAVFHQETHAGRAPLGKMKAKAKEGSGAGNNPFAFLKLFKDRQLGLLTSGNACHLLCDYAMEVDQGVYV